jgi:TRAP-type C4-dicarboxylate transport system permease small subunit
MRDAVEKLIIVLERAAGLVFMVITAVTLAQVVCRYALGFSLSWSHELTILLLIWVVWLCVPVGLHRCQHLAVTILRDHLGPAARSRLNWIDWVLTVFFFGLLLLLTFPVIDAFEGMNLLTLPIPTNARFYAASVGSLLALCVLLAKAQRRRRPDP